MKMLPVQLSLNPLNPGLWGDMLWRCPPAPPSQLAELKTQLPPSLPSDPRLWSREDVLVFLRFCVREFDLPKLDFDLFQMNGKALCLLTRADFGHRCPGAGDVLHNVLQMLIIESHMMQWHLPNSPVTPTSRYPLSPHSHPPTPTWPPMGAPPESPFHNTAAHMAAHHFMAPNSVTLSPPPSVDSQASSPPQSQYQNSAGGGSSSSNGGTSNGTAAATSALALLPSTSANGSSNGCIGGSNSNGNGSSLASATSAAAAASAVLGAAAAAAASSFGVPMKGISTSSNHSDSEEEYSEPGSGKSIATGPSGGGQYNASPPTTPILKEIKHNWSQQLTNSFVNSWQQQQQQHQQQQQQQQQQAQAAQQQQSQQPPQKLSLENGVGGLNGISSGPNGGSISAPTTPSYMYKVKREFFPENSEPNTNGRLLWDFLQQLLNDRNQKYSDLIAWKCRDTGVFKIVDPAGLAKLWGIQKNHLSMNYDKMSRALRYYYRVNILRKVQGERHCYQFLRNPTELKNIKNISLLRQSTQGSGNASGGATSANATAASSMTTNGGGGGGGVSAMSSTNNSNNNQSPSTNANSTNVWSLPGHHHQHHQQQQQQTHHHHHQQQHLAQQQQQQQQAQQSLLLPQSPQRPASSNGSNRDNHPMSLPASVAAVAAAAAAAYGPPPSSPLFMHAINGAFHYLSANAASSVGPPPNSPAAVAGMLPTTPSEKFQFHSLKIEATNSGSASNSSNGGHDSSSDELKPTDLSVNGGSSNSERKNFQSPTPPQTNAGEDCYPLIRNADGLTTIKLIRYNDQQSTTTTTATQSSESAELPKHSNEEQRHQQTSPIDHATNDLKGEQQQQQHRNSTPVPMESENIGEESSSSSHFHQILPTDMRQ